MSGQIYVPAALNLNTNRTGGSVGPRADLNVEEKSKNPWPCQELNPGRTARILI